MAAARRVFARQGYATTKITDITAEAGRAAGGIYRYFASKSAVLEALAEDFLTALHDRVVGKAGHDHTMTTREDVREHVQAYWETYREFLPEMVAIFQASMSEPVFAAIWREMRTRDLVIWRDHVKEMRAHFGKPVEDAPTIGVMIVSLLEHYCYTTLLSDDSADINDEQVVNSLAEFIYGGIVGA
jgi:AcrR family transcriptional regulator